MPFSDAVQDIINRAHGIISTAQNAGGVNVSPIDAVKNAAAGAQADLNNAGLTPGKTVDIPGVGTVTIPGGSGSNATSHGTIQNPGSGSSVSLPSWAIPALVVLGLAFFLKRR